MEKIIKTLISPALSLIASCFLALGLAACRPHLAGAPGAPTLSPAATAQPTATPVSEDPAPPIPKAADFFEYVFSSGLRVEYPVGWLLEASHAPGGVESVWLRPADPFQAAIGLEVAHRPLEDRQVSDPSTWVPNEGGYEIHWSQKVSVGALEGQQFVWGVRREGTWAGLPSLMAVFYDSNRELDIRLTTEFTPQQLELVQSSGLKEAVSTGFGEFKQILEGLKFVEALVPVTLRGVVLAGAELGEHKVYCAEGLYLVADQESPVRQKRVILLRQASSAGQPELFIGPQWNRAAVSVTGTYPAQDMFCEALVCECEDYLIVESIESY